MRRPPIAAYSHLDFCSKAVVRDRAESPAGAHMWSCSVEFAEVKTRRQALRLATVTIADESDPLVAITPSRNAITGNRDAIGQGMRAEECQSTDGCSTDPMGERIARRRARTNY